MSAKEALLAFIRAVQAEDEESGRLHGVSRRITLPDRWSTAELTLSFGRGYFDQSKVFVYLDNDVVGEAETVEAVNAYWEGRVPKVNEKV